MPTILTHALLPLIAASAVPAKVPRRLIVAGMVAAVLPDADVVTGMVFGVPHTHDFGHRGATHTLLFALIIGMLGASAAPKLRASRTAAFAFLFLCTLSHPVADMLTDGGKGIMLLWPAEDDRFKFLLHPVAVSPVGLQAFETGRIWTVLLSEALWLWLPGALLAFLARLVANSRKRRSTTD